MSAQRVDADAQSTVVCLDGMQITRLDAAINLADRVLCEGGGLLRHEHQDVSTAWLATRREGLALQPDSCELMRLKLPASVPDVETKVR